MSTSSSSSQFVEAPLSPLPDNPKRTSTPVAFYVDREQPGEHSNPVFDELEVFEPVKLIPLHNVFKWKIFFGNQIQWGFTDADEFIKYMMNDFPKNYYYEVSRRMCEHVTCHIACLKSVNEEVKKMRDDPNQLALTIGLAVTGRDAVATYEEMDNVVWTF